MFPLPSVTEIYVVWHPGDRGGEVVAKRLVNHFHGPPFTGLVSGAVDVYQRSQGWRGPDDAPRPIPLPGTPPPAWIREAELVAIVPVLGTELASAVEDHAGRWHDYVMTLLAGHEAFPHRIAIFPVILDRAAVHGTRAGSLLGRFQNVGPEPIDPADPTDVDWLVRDLTQGLAQLADGGITGRLNVFISHTRGGTDPAIGSGLVSQVRWAISQTRLKDFFDARDLQPGRDRNEAIDSSAATSAMLALRTDGYASNTWCQREILTAKTAGMPVVILDALSRGDERGSFLMDHVPRVPVRHAGDNWRLEDINTGLNRLVNECLKRVLWQRQRRLGFHLDRDIAWWAPYSPEPVTFLAWLRQEKIADGSDMDRPLRIFHPDPPLGPDEIRVLDEIASMAGVRGGLEILTPRTHAAQGG